MSTGTAIWRLRYALVFLLVAGVYWPMGFYPFHPLTVFANHADFADDRSLSFPQDGIAYTLGTPAWLETAVERGVLELQLKIRPASIAQEEAVIFALGNANGERNFKVGQHQRSLVIRYLCSNCGQRGSKTFYIPKVFTREDWYALDIKLTKRHLSVAVGGTTAWERPLQEPAFEGWLPQAVVTVGNVPEFFYPWHGTLQSVLIKIDQQEFDYLSVGQLYAPADYQRLQLRSVRNFFVPGEIDFSPDQVHDWLVNFFGFIPLAALVAWLWRQHSPILISVAASFLTSLSIELVQVFLPWRTPSVHDLVLNTFGGLVGACLALIMIRLLGARGPHLKPLPTKRPP